MNAPQPGFASDGIRTAGVADAAAIAAISVACWRDAYRDVLDPAILAARSVHESAGRWRGYLSHPAGRTIVLVAESEGLIVGFGSAIRQRDPHLAAIGYSGEIATLYVRPEDQRRGIGARLLAGLARRLVDAGHASASVWVLERNLSGRRFYEELRGRLLPLRHELPRLGNAAEVAYAWPVLRTLSAGPPRPAPASQPVSILEGERP